jgi:hypothetical protein
MNIKDIGRDALNFVESQLADVGEVSMLTSVQSFRLGYGSVSGDGSDVAEVCIFDVLYRSLKRAVALFEQAADEDDHDAETGQMVLTGFTRLLKAYTVEREGDVKLVSTRLLTDTELKARATQYRKSAKGLIEHAEEIEHYLRNRTAYDSANSTEQLISREVES